MNEYEEKIATLTAKATLLNRDLKTKQIYRLMQYFTKFSITEAKYLTYIAIKTESIPYNMKDEYEMFIQKEIQEMFQSPDRLSYVHNYQECAVNAWDITRNIIDIVE
jgi:hypothetical protein